MLADLNDEFDATWGVRLVIRTGVATGDVVVGEARAGPARPHRRHHAHLIGHGAERSAARGPDRRLDDTTSCSDQIEAEPHGPVTPRAWTSPIPAIGWSAVHPRSRPRQAAARGGERRADRAAAPPESRKTVTLVFADPKPTSLTDEPPSAEALRDVMTRYFEAMRQALARHGGTVEKFIGDAVMAVYGLPVRHEDDAIRAIRAAAEMQAALPGAQRGVPADWGLELHNHIGVNTGEVIAGDASTGQRLVTGDAVNTAARLEQAAGPGEIILGDLTYRLARDEIDVEAIAPLTLKGKAEPVPAYRLIGVRERSSGRATTEAAPFVGREAEMGRAAVALAEAQRRSGAAC